MKAEGGRTKTEGPRGILPLGGSDPGAPGAGEGALMAHRNKQPIFQQLPSPLVPRDPPKGRVKCDAARCARRSQREDEAADGAGTINTYTRAYLFQTPLAATHIP